MAEQTKARETAWLQARELTPEKIKLAQQALEEIRAGEKVFEAIRHNPLADGYLSKNILVTVYRELVRRGEWENDPALLAKIRMKPMLWLPSISLPTAGARTWLLKWWASILPFNWQSNRCGKAARCPWWVT